MIPPTIVMEAVAQVGAVLVLASPENQDGFHIWSAWIASAIAAWFVPATRFTSK